MTDSTLNPNLDPATGLPWNPATHYCWGEVRKPVTDAPPPIGTEPIRVCGSKEWNQCLMRLQSEGIRIWAVNVIKGATYEIEIWPKGTELLTWKQMSANVKTVTVPVIAPPARVAVQKKLL